MEPQKPRSGTTPDGVTIAVDAMGGDFAPRAVIVGAADAAAAGTRVILVGDGEILRRQVDRELEQRNAEKDDADGLADRLVIEHAGEVVAMEERPTAVLKKSRASVRVCAEIVKEGRARAMVSSGNTGATMIAAKTVLGTLPGVDRPALAGVFPNRKGRTVLLDVGANLGAKPAHLRQFAVMGHFFAQEILGTPAPRVGLLSVGEEEGKGTEFTRRVYDVLEQTGLNFVGNVEGSDLFRGTVDVIVCDGFLGNVVLKSSESLAAFLGDLIQRELTVTMRGRLGQSLARPAVESFRRQTDWVEYGAAPLLGVVAGCFIGHGRSNARAVRNAILRAREYCEAELDQKIRRKVAELHDREATLIELEET